MERGGGGAEGNRKSQDERFRILKQDSKLVNILTYLLINCRGSVRLTFICLFN